jgi:hypothetical protein
MSKRQVLMLIGVWVILLAAPGFPSGWKSFLLLVTGLGIVVFGYRMNGSAPASPAAPRDLPFVEHKNPEQAAPSSAAPHTDDRPVA